MKLLAADFTPIVEVSNNLGVKTLNKKLSMPGAEGSNITVAPLSLTTIILSLALGAEGQTRTELLSLLDLGRADAAAKPLAKLDILWEDLALLSKQLQVGNKGLTHDLGFFYDERHPLLASYSELMAKSLAVKCMPLLSRQSDAVVSQLNAWVKQKTKGEMGNLMVPAMLRTESTLYCIDITMFRAAWLSPFSPEDTKKAAFYTAKGATPQVGAFMNDRLCREFVLKDGFQIVWKGYKDSSVVMMIVLPVGAKTPEFLLEESSLAEWLSVRRARESILNAKDFKPKMTDLAS